MKWIISGNKITWLDYGWATMHIFWIDFSISEAYKINVLVISLFEENQPKKIQ